MKRYLLDEFPYFSDKLESTPASGAFADAPLYDEAKQSDAGITRRDFAFLMASLGAAVIADTMGFIPWRGTLVKAYADEVGNLSYTITVFKRWEVPLILYDVTKSKDKEHIFAIPGATLRVRSNDTGADSGEITTNGEGFALLDARNFGAEGFDGTYEFMGLVKAWKDGYRTYETGIARFRSGRETDFATEPLEGRPYLQCAVFDDWDIQYESDISFTRSKTNEVDHTFLVKIAGADASKAKVRIFQENGRTAGNATPTASDDGSWQAQINGKFLYTDDAVCLDAGSPVLIGVEIGEVSFTVTTKMQVEEAVLNKAIIGETGEFDMMSPLAASLPTAEGQTSVGEQALQTSGMTIHIPDSVGVIGGMDVPLLFPGSIATVYLDPAGYYSVMASLSSSRSPFGSKDKTTDAWKYSNAKDTANELKGSFAEWASAVVQRNRGMFTNSGLKPTHQGTGVFTVELTAGAGVYFSKLPKDHEIYKAGYPAQDLTIWKGGLTGFLEAEAEIALTEQFLVGGMVPLFVQFCISLNSNFQVDGECFHWSKPDSNKPVPLGTEVKNPNQSGLTWKNELTLALSVGAGVADVAFVAIRGSATLVYTLSCFFHNPYKGLALESTHANPRNRVVFKAALVACFQLLLFKGSMPIVGGSWTLYDTWEPVKDDGESGVLAFEDVPFEQFSSDFYVNENGFSLNAPQGKLGDALLSELLVPVTAEELIGSAEFEQVGSVSLTPEDGLVGVETLEPVFAPINQGSVGALQAGHPLLTQSVVGIDGGIPVPIETLMYQNVFSNPRMKVVTHKNEKYLLRILPVIISGGEPRTRLTVAKFDEGANSWGVPTVIQNGAFAWAESRKDLHDYDFAVAMADKHNELGMYLDKGYMRIVLVSGTRPDGLGSGTVGDAAAKTVLTLLSIDWDFSVKNVVSTKEFGGAQSQGAVAVMNPFIDSYYIDTPAVIYAKDAGITTIAGAFVRTAATSDALFTGPFSEEPYLWADGKIASEEYGKTSGFSPLALTPWETRFPDDVDKTSLTFAIGSSGSLNDMRAFWFYTFLGEDGISHGRVLGIHFDTYMTDKLIVLEAQQKDYDNVSGVQAIFDKKVFDGGSYTFGLRDFTGFLVSGGTDDNPTLSRYVFKHGQVNDFDIYDVTLENRFKVQSFLMSEDGNALLYAETLEGEEPVTYDPLGNEIPGEEFQEYGISALSCVIGADGSYKYTRPFRLCNLSHPVDNMTAVEAADSFCFLTSSIKDLKTSCADIYYFTVPKLLHVTALGFGSVNQLVCAGMEEKFWVSARNDGNKIASAFDLQISTVDGSFSDTAHIDLSSPSVEKVASAFDGFGTPPTAVAADLQGGGWNSGTPVEVGAVAEGGALLPTEERVLKFTWTVPEQWSGNVELQVQVVAGSVKLATSGVAQEQEDEAVILQGHHVPSIAETIKPVTSEALVYADSSQGMAQTTNVERSEYRYADGKRGEDASSLVNTGDSTEPLTGAAALAAAAGAGVVAYSARRTKLENTED